MCKASASYVKLDLWLRLTKLGLSGKTVACCMKSYLVLGGLVTVIYHGNNEIVLLYSDSLWILSIPSLMCYERLKFKLHTLVAPDPLTDV